MTTMIENMKKKQAAALSAALATGKTKAEALAEAAGNTVLTTLITKIRDSDFCIKTPGKVVNICREDIVDLQNSNLSTDIVIDTVTGELQELHKDLSPCIPDDAEVLLKCKSYDTDIINCPGTAPILPSGTIKYSDPSSEAKLGDNC